MNALRKAVLTVTVIAVMGTVQASGGQATDYADPKGYYTLTPPAGWTRKDFANDPRSKVQFITPDGAGQLGIIVRPDSKSFGDILADAKGNAENQKRNFPDGSFVVTETTLCGVKGVKVENTVAGMVRQDLYLFMSGGLHFNIAFGAPNQTLFDKFKRDAQTAIDSLRPRGATVQATEVEVQRGREASSVRQVQIAFNLSGVTQGVAAAEELAKAESGNETAAKLLQQLKALASTPVVFISREQGGQKIYRAAMDGSGKKCLTPSNAAEDMPMLSPDGTSIVFRSERSGNQDIWKMDSDDRNPVQLTQNTDKDSEPSWSPDGQRIIYASKQGGAWSVWSMNSDGAGKKKLLDDAGGASLSPDGTRLVFSRGRPPQIWVAKADGTEPRRLTTGPAMNASPVWTRDGKRIAFISSRDGNVAVYIMDEDGNKQTRITKGAGNNGGRISFSQDGQWLSFSSDRDGRMQLYVMALDGMMETHILASPSDTLTAHMGGSHDK